MYLISPVCGSVLGSTVAEAMRRPTPLCWGYPDREHGMDVVWKTYRVGADEGVWEPTSYNVRADDGANPLRT